MIRIPLAVVHTSHLHDTLAVLDNLFVLPDPMAVLNWSWTGTVLLGIILMIWLIMQAACIGFTAPIQYMTALNGLLIFGVSFVKFCALTKVLPQYIKVG